MSAIVVLQPTTRFVVEWEDLEEVTVDPDEIAADEADLVDAVRERLAAAQAERRPDPEDDRDAMIGEPLF